MDEHQGNILPFLIGMATGFLFYAFGYVLGMLFSLLDRAAER